MPVWVKLAYKHHLHPRMRFETGIYERAHYRAFSTERAGPDGHLQDVVVNDALVLYSLSTWVRFGSVGAASDISLPTVH